MAHDYLAINYTDPSK